LTRLLEQLWNGRDFDDASEKVFEEAIGNFEVWRHQPGAQGVRLLRRIPRNGVKRSAFMRAPTWKPHHEACVLARSLCLVGMDDERIFPGPGLFLDWLGGATAEDQVSWDLAISYASEDLALARGIWQQLQQEFRVFFAPAGNAYLWGEDLNRLLPHVYGQQSRYVLILSSKDYVRKHWTKFEFEATLRTMRRRLLLVDLGAIPESMPEDVVYRPSSPDALISLIPTLKQKLSQRPRGSS
jgi:hypothetical protein